MSNIIDLLNGRTTRCNGAFSLKVYAKENVIVCVKAVFRMLARLDFFIHGPSFSLLEF